MRLQVERNLWRQGYKVVAGLDEVGRGSLAGPVLAGAVSLMINPNFKIRMSNKIQNAKTKNFQLRDSKKLTPSVRQQLYTILTKHPNIVWATGRAGERVIERVNILEATKLAMKRALKSLERKLSFKSNFYSKSKNHGRRNFVKGYFGAGLVDFLVLDGKIKLNLAIAQKSIVKADSKVFSCAAASIIAKVCRDRYMLKLHKKFPQYGFDIHKGYATKPHRLALKKYGLCPAHRCSFAPLARR